MFLLKNDFIKTQREYFLENNTWNVNKDNISEYNDFIKNNDEGQVYFEIIQSIKDLCFLDGEVFINNFNGYQGWTNYRLWIKDDSGLVSIPLSSIIKYYDYKCPDVEEYKKASEFVSTPGSGIFEGDNIDDFTCVFKNISGGYSTWKYDLVHDKYIQYAISLGEYLELDEEQTSTIYKKRSTLKRKYKDLESWDTNELIDGIFPSSNKSSSINTSNSLLSDSQIDEFFYDFLLNNVKDKIDEKTPFYSKIMLSFDKIKEGDFKESKEIFEEILKEDYNEKYSKIGLDIIKMSNLKVENLDDNDKIIDKYKGDLKSLFQIFNAHLKLIISKDLYIEGINYAVQKRNQIKESQMKAAGSVLTATMASNSNSKTVKNIGYGVAGGMLYSAGSSRSEASISESLELQYIEAGYNLCISTSMYVKSLKSKVSVVYKDKFFFKTLSDIVEMYKKLVVQEFLENSSWGYWSDYKNKLNSKMFAHGYRYFQLIDSIGIDNDIFLENKQDFDKMFKMFSDLNEELIKKDKRKKLIIWSSLVWLFIGFFVMGINVGPEGILVNSIICVSLSFFIGPRMGRHEKHQELKNSFELVLDKLQKNDYNNFMR